MISLPTDIKSIFERIERNNYYAIVRKHFHVTSSGITAAKTAAVELRNSDLARLYVLVQRGERYEKAIHTVRARVAETYSTMCDTDLQRGIATIVDATFIDIITEAEREAEGEGK